MQDKNVEAGVTLAWRVRDQCQRACSVWLASLRLCCSCSQEKEKNQEVTACERALNHRVYCTAETL